MSTLIIIGLLLWATLAIHKSKKQKREALRRAEMDRRTKEQIARIRANAKVEAQRMRAVVAEQQKQAKEQARQAAILAKHEEEIEKLKFRMAQAESDIEHFTEQIANLYALLDIEMMAQSSSVPGSAEDAKHQRKIITLNNQIHTAETRLERAKFNKEQAERKIA